MYQSEILREPFDLKLFVYHCARRLHLICLGALLGFMLIGGGYYLVKVVLADQNTYKLVDKYYVEYAADPQTAYNYSYFAGYTWNDWLTSDECTEQIRDSLSFEMEKEDLVTAVLAELKSDLRIMYVTVHQDDAAKAEEIAEAYRAYLEKFAQNQRELDGIRLIDRSGPELDPGDVRVLNACVLGLVIGVFFSWFFVGFKYLISDRIYLPETITTRYGIPAAGYISGVDLSDEKAVRPSDDLIVNLNYLFKDKKIGLTAVDPQLDLKAVEKILPEADYTLIPSPMQVAESTALLKNMEGRVLLINAGYDAHQAILALLHRTKLQDVTFDAAVLVNADERLINFYRGKSFRRAECKKK